MALRNLGKHLSRNAHACPSVKLVLYEKFIFVVKFLFFVTIRVFQVNYGGLLLQALLEHWPRPYNTEDESDLEQVRQPDLDFLKFSFLL